MAERAPGAAGGGPAAASPNGAAEPVTLVLSLEARAGHDLTAGYRRDIVKNYWTCL